MFWLSGTPTTPGLSALGRTQASLDLGGPTSLALKDQSLPPQGVCPRAGGKWVNDETGEWFWDACKRHSCVICGPRAAHVTALAIAVCEPERFVRFSLAGDDWPTIRSRVFRVSYDVRAAGFSWNLAYAVERNPKGTGFLAHAYQWGDFVPQRRLQAICSRRGMGFPDIRSWKQLGAQGTAYAMKAATGYAMKGADRADGLREYLDLNGGRLIHASRGFWRDGPKGGRLAGIDAARAVALERKFGPRSVGSWRLMGWKEVNAA